MEVQWVYDVHGDYLEIEGIRYSGDLFRQLGGLFGVGSVFKLVQRQNQSIALEKIEYQESNHVEQLDALKEKACPKPSEFNVLLEGLMHLADVIGGHQRQAKMVAEMIKVSK